MELLNKLKPNPKNPRILRDEKYLQLKEKIKDFPEMLEKRPIVYDEAFMVLGGNQRLRILQELVKEKFEIKDSYFAQAIGWSEAKKNQFIITDNIADGDWDWNILANEWNEEQLEKWGINLGSWQNEDLDANKEFQDMPEYGDASQGEPVRSLMVHFQTEEDVKAFAELIKQELTEKTKYIWFPFREKESLNSQGFVKKE